MEIAAEVWLSGLAPRAGKASTRFPEGTLVRSLLALATPRSPRGRGAAQSYTCPSNVAPQAERGMTDKDVTHGHAVKQQLNQPPPRTFEEREGWWASVGANVEFAQNRQARGMCSPGARHPQVQPGAVSRHPLATQLKTHPYYHRITLKGRKQAALLMQVRAWSSRRLHRVNAVLSWRYAWQAAS